MKRNSLILLIICSLIFGACGSVTPGTDEAGKKPSTSTQTQVSTTNPVVTATPALQTPAGNKNENADPGLDDHGFESDTPMEGMIDLEKLTPSDIERLYNDFISGPVDITYEKSMLSKSYHEIYQEMKDVSIVTTRYFNRGYNMIIKFIELASPHPVLTFTANGDVYLRSKVTSRSYPDLEEKKYYTHVAPEDINDYIKSLGGYDSAPLFPEIIFDGYWDTYVLPYEQDNSGMGVLYGYAMYNGELLNSLITIDRFNNRITQIDVSNAQLWQQVSPEDFDDMEEYFASLVLPDIITTCHMEAPWVEELITDDNGTPRVNWRTLPQDEEKYMLSIITGAIKDDDSYQSVDPEDFKTYYLGSLAHQDSLQVTKEGNPFGRVVADDIADFFFDGVPFDFNNYEFIPY